MKGRRSIVVFWDILSSFETYIFLYLTQTQGLGAIDGIALDDYIIQSGWIYEGSGPRLGTYETATVHATM